MSLSLQFTGQPEDILCVPAGAEAGLPVDEINCAVVRAEAVITMVMMALSDSDGRPADHVLNDALWCAQSQLALIKKMAYHGHESAKLKGGGRL